MFYFWSLESILYLWRFGVHPPFIILRGGGPTPATLIWQSNIREQEEELQIPLACIAQRDKRCATPISATLRHQRLVELLGRDLFEELELEGPKLAAAEDFNLQMSNREVKGSPLVHVNCSASLPRQFVKFCQRHRLKSIALLILVVTSGTLVVKECILCHS